jgi:hypothetical protein
MQSNFSSHTLAEIFRDLYMGERSGVLHLARGGVEKRIYFDRGMILFAESGIEEEDLGRRLVSEGKISAGALAEAKRNITEGKDVAQVLVNRGLIGKEALSYTVRFVVERVVQSVFLWEGGSARFSEGSLLQEIFESDIVFTFEVILKGVSAMVGFEPIQDALKGHANRLRLRTPSPCPLERLALTSSHGYILSRIDGTTSVSEVITLLPPTEEQLACRFLYGLLVMGVVSYDPPVGEGPFQITQILRDHADQVTLEREQEKSISQAYGTVLSSAAHEILGVPTDASREAIEAAYASAKERFNRDKILPRVRERLRSELAVVESRLVESFLALTRVRSAEPASRIEEGEAAAKEGFGGLLVRVELDKAVAKKEMEEHERVAEGHYGKARKYMREGDYHNAIQYAKLAISYRPEDARFYFLLAECQTRNPEARWQRMAEQSYLKAVELDPWNVEYPLSLGRLYKRRGFALRARKQFQRVLELAPSHEAALDELQSLG